MLVTVSLGVCWAQLSSVLIQFDSIPWTGEKDVHLINYLVCSPICGFLFRNLKSQCLGISQLFLCAFLLSVYFNLSCARNAVPFVHRTYSVHYSICQCMANVNESLIFIAHIGQHWHFETVTYSSAN